MKEINTVNNTRNREIRVFPNPVRDQFTVLTQGIGLRSLELISLNGQVIKKMVFMDRSVKVDISAFQEGVYFLRIRCVDSVSTGRIMKY